MRVQQRYEWTYLYGFVHPHSGRTEWLILPTVYLEIMNLALAHFAHAVGASNDKRIALVLDQAGWAWQCSSPGSSGSPHALFTARQEAHIQRRHILLHQRDIVHRAPCFHWWPPDPSKHMEFKEFDMAQL